MQISSIRQKTGALCFAAGGLIYLLAEKISANGWQRPAYSYLHNYISDLGIAACGATPDGRNICSPAHAVMNAGFAAEGVLFFIACWLLRPVFTGPGERAFVFFGLLHGIGGVMIAIFHSGGGTGGITVHQTGAVLAIAGGNLCLLTAGWIKRQHEGWRGFAGVSLLLGSLGLISMVTISLDILPVGLIERLAVYTITLWQIGTGIGLSIQHRN